MLKYEDFIRMSSGLTGNKLYKYNTILKKAALSQFSDNALKQIKATISEESARKDCFQLSKHRKALTTILLLTSLLGGCISIFGILALSVFMGLSISSIIIIIPILQTKRFLVNSKEDITEATNNIKQIDTTLKDRTKISRAINIEYQEIESNGLTFRENKHEGPKSNRKIFFDLNMLIEELLSKMPNDKKVIYVKKFNQLIALYLNNILGFPEFHSELLKLSDEMIEIINIDPTSLKYGYILSRTK